MNFQNCLLQIDSKAIHDFLSKEHIGEFILLVLAAVVATKIDWFLTLPVKLFSSFKKIRKSNVKSIWKFEVKSNEVKPGVHFNITSFKKVFYERDSFISIKEKIIEEKKNLILIGRSGLGKTRCVFEIISKAKKKYEILVPFLTRPESFEFKSSFKKRKSVILFIDDLQKYNTADINFYLENLIPTSSEVQLLCTCRSEHEENIFSNFQINNLERYDLKEWTEKEGKSLAVLLNIDFNANAFDHTAASLLYKLEKLKEQYKQLTRNEIIILESVKLLKTISLYCNSGSVKEVAEKVFDLEKEYLSYNTWRTEFKKLKTIGFYDIDSEGEVVINDIYLSELIELNFHSAFNRFFKFAKEKKESGFLFYCGIYFENIFDFKNAKKCYSEAARIFPNYASAYYRLGSLYLSKADKEENSFNIKEAKDSIVIAINYLLQAIKLKSTDYHYFVTIGYVYSKAASVFDKLHDKPNEQLNLNEAIRNFSKAISLNPKNSSAYRMRGFCYFQLSDFDQAQLDYETTLKIKPDSYKAYFGLGLVYFALAKHTKALENYRICIELKKDYFQAYNNIGYVIQNNIEYANLYAEEIKIDAFEAIKNYLLSIWYSRGKHFVAYLNLGQMYSEINEFDKAIKVQNIVINKSPNYSEPYASRAYAFNRLKRYADAERDLLMALELKPNSEGFIHSLAFCYQKMAQEKMDEGNSSQAKSFFLKAIKNYDTLIAGKNETQKVSAWLGKAITLQRMGNSNEGFEILTKLFSDNAGNTKVLSIILQSLRATNNDEQIIYFLSILLELVKQNKIILIGKELMEACTKQIQRLSKNKMLSYSSKELLRLLKETYPNSYFVHKTSGVFNLNKGISEITLNSKMKYLLEAEKDFLNGKIIVPKNPVFLKYLGVTNAKKCEVLKEIYNQTKMNEELVNYNNQFYLTKKMFEDSEKEFSDYPELKVEHCIFLYSNNMQLEAQIIDAEVRLLFAKQLANKQKDESQIMEELKELDEIKSKLYTPDQLL